MSWYPGYRLDRSLSQDKDISFADLVTALWGDEQGWLRMGFLSPETRKMTVEVYKYPDALHEAQRAAQAAAGTHDVYWSSVPLGMPKRYLERGESLFDYVTDYVTVLHADLDECDPRLLLVPPTVLAATSEGRTQGYWKLAEPISKTQAEDICKRIAYQHRDSGADLAWDLAHLLRVVGTTNHKDGRGKAGVSVATLNPDAVYQVSDFDKYPESRTVPSKIETLPTPAMSTVDLNSLREPLKSLIHREIPEGDGEKRLYAVTTQAWDDGHTLDEILDIVAQWAALYRTRFVGRTEAQVAHILSKKANEAQGQLTELRLKMSQKSTVEPESFELDEFLDQDEPEYDWLIPDLLERQDRLIITGGEGHGKSTFVRQVGIQAASGIHPITREPMEPVRVLLVDLENPKRIIRRKLRDLRHTAGSAYRKGNMAVSSKPEGLNLAEAEDIKWLRVELERNTPDLVCIGPLYKLTNTDLSDNQASKEIATTLDQLRADFDIALIMEAHQRHASPGESRPVRPYGASLWVRWPEFGFNLAQDGRWIPFRNPRDERPWPEAFRRGDPFKGEWPWMIGSGGLAAELADGLHRTNDAVLTLVAIVTENPGITTADLTAYLKRKTGIKANSELSRIIKDAVEDGTILRNPHGRAFGHFAPDYIDELASRD